MADADEVLAVRSAAISAKATMDPSRTSGWWIHGARYELAARAHLVSLADDNEEWFDDSSPLTSQMVSRTLCDSQGWLLSPAPRPLTADGDFASALPDFYTHAGVDSTSAAYHRLFDDWKIREAALTVLDMGCINWLNGPTTELTQTLWDTIEDVGNTKGFVADPSALVKEPLAAELGGATRRILDLPAIRCLPSLHVGRAMGLVLSGEGIWRLALTRESTLTRPVSSVDAALEVVLAPTS